MSHFSIAIIHEDNESIDDVLAPYDENMEIIYTKSKAEHIAKFREDTLDYMKSVTYKEYEADPEEYIEECNNPKHIEYITSFKERLSWTDEQAYVEQIKYYEPEQINKDGSTNETYNPDSKWDWYQLGGRWSGMLIPKAGTTSAIHGSKSLLDDRPEDKTKFDSILLKDIDWDITNNPYKFSTFALIINNKWYESGSMGWFGISSNNKEPEDWNNFVTKTIDDANQNLRLSIVDCHI